MGYINKFDKNKHMEHYMRLSSALEVEGVTENSVPSIGFVYEDEGHAVAYCFLRKVEGGYGQLDGLLVNPEFDSELRHVAIDSVKEECINAAKDLDITHIFSFCKVEAPIKRAIERGFMTIPHTIMVLDLTKEV